MIQGTTPTLLIYCEGFNLEDVSKVIITLSQSKVQINKTEADVIINMAENCFEVRFTQEDTLQLMLCELVRIQIKVLDVSGEVLASEIATVKVEEILNKEVLQ